MVLNKSKLLPIIVGAVVLLFLIVAGFFVLHKEPKKQSSEASAKYNTITDTSAGISFNMSKIFTPIPREELAAMNPGFTYGFSVAGDPKATCIISQSKLAASGIVTPTQLRDGIIKEIKKIHPDVKLDNPATASKIARFGEAQGVLLEVTYSDGATKIKRIEIIGLGKTTQVIAYCQSLSKDNQRYYKDFTIFFSSLKLSS